jgi:hypothetical protein
MYGDPVDIDAFLQRPLVARVATGGPTLCPLWYLYEEPTFYWLTDTGNFLHRRYWLGSVWYWSSTCATSTPGKSSTSGPEASARSFPSIELVR